MLPALLTPVLWLVLLEHNFQRGRSTNNKNLHRRVMLASSKKHHCLPPQRQRRHVSSIFCQEADTQIDGHPASAPRHAPAPATSPPPGRIPKDAQCWGAGGWPPQGLWAPTRALWPPTRALSPPTRALSPARGLPRRRRLRGERAPSPRLGFGGATVDSNPRSGKFTACTRMLSQFKSLCQLILPWSKNPLRVSFQPWKTLACFPYALKLPKSQRLVWLNITI